MILEATKSLYNLTRRSIFGAQSGLQYLELLSDKLSLRLNFQNADGYDCLNSSRKQRVFFISFDYSQPGINCLGGLDRVALRRK